MEGAREAIKSIKPEVALSWALLLKEMVGGVRSPEVFGTQFNVAEERGLAGDVLPGQHLDGGALVLAPLFLDQTSCKSPKFYLLLGHQTLWLHRACGTRCRVCCVCVCVCARTCMLLLFLKGT